MKEFVVGPLQGAKPLCDGCWTTTAERDSHRRFTVRQRFSAYLFSLTDLTILTILTIVGSIPIKPHPERGLTRLRSILIPEGFCVGACADLSIAPSPE